MEKISYPSQSSYFNHSSMSLSNVVWRALLGYLLFDRASADYTCTYKGDLLRTHDNKVRAADGLKLCNDWFATMVSDKGTILGTSVLDTGPQKGDVLKMQTGVNPCNCPQTLRVGPLENKEFAITWPQAPWYLKGREFDCTGNSTSDAIQLFNGHAKGYQILTPSCSTVEKGMICAWLTNRNTIMGQFFDRDLKVLGRTFQIAAAKAGRANFQVVSVGTNAIAVWQEKDKTYGQEIFLQGIDFNGHLLGKLESVAQFRHGDQLDPKATITGEGYLIAWTGPSKELNGKTGLYIRGVNSTLGFLPELLLTETKNSLTRPLIHCAGSNCPMVFSQHEDDQMFLQAAIFDSEKYALSHQVWEISNDTDKGFPADLIAISSTSFALLLDNRDIKAQYGDLIFTRLFQQSAIPYWHQPLIAGGSALYLLCVALGALLGILQRNKQNQQNPERQKIINV